MTDKLMAGLDLHSNNLFCGIIDAQGKRVFERRLPCQMEAVRAALAQYRASLEGVAVESTYNWYWLVDGLAEAGYDVKLANPAAMHQYSGLKHSDDKSDAFWLAEQLRLKILPTGWICPRPLRKVRDLLRRRILLVHQRTALILSLKSLHVRTFGRPLAQAKGCTVGQVRKLFDDHAEQLIAGLEMTHIRQLTQSIRQIEKKVLALTRHTPSYKSLQTLPGVGMILALTITLETGDITRFPTAGDFASYCRCVDSRRISNRKKKGENNAKCGNAYLAWAYVEASNFARRFDPWCQQFWDRKAAQAGNVVATKALACKLAKASWHLMKEQSSYDPGRMFPGCRPAVANPPRPGFVAREPCPQTGRPGRRATGVPACGRGAEGGAQVASQQSPILRSGTGKLGKKKGAVQR
jgi:transposase